MERVEKMFKKKGSSKPEIKPAGEADKGWHEYVDRQCENDVREIMEHKNKPVTPEQITAGFLIGYGNAKEMFRQSIDAVMKENRILKRENLILKANNESLAERLEALEGKAKHNDVGEDLDNNNDDRGDSDELSYFELLP